MAGLSDYDFVASLVLWLVVPSFVSKLLLRQFYSMRYSNPGQRPRPGSVLYQRDYKKAYALVIIGYFAYCMIQFCRNLKPTYYDVIGVPRYNVDRNLKTHFRQTMVNLHPDKNPNGNAEGFMQIKQVYEVLNTDSLRSAYDCYGPDVLRTVNMSSSKSGGARAAAVDYFTQALMEWTAFYAATAVFFVIASGMGNRNGLFWRGLGLFLVACIDLYVLMRPSKFGIVRSLAGPSITGLGYLVRLWYSIPVFQKLAFLRQAYMYAGMAFGQITGLAKADTPATTIKNLAVRANEISKAALSKEADYHISSAVEPVSRDEGMRELLRRKMGKLSAELQFYEILDPTDRQRLVPGNKKSD